MPNSEEDADWNWWCDYCQRGKIGYQPLPDSMEVTDLGGELICEECSAPAITAVAQYDCSDERVWIYYRDNEPPAIETVQGKKAQKQDEHRFQEPVDVLTATDTIEEKADEDTLTLVPPYDE
jgi:hypothetical protein